MQGSVSEGMVAWVASLKNESIIDVEGVLVKPEAPVKSCSIQGLELSVQKVYCVNETLVQKLPFEMKDATRALKKGESEGLGDANPNEKRRSRNKAAEARRRSPRSSP